MTSAPAGKDASLDDGLSAGDVKARAASGSALLIAKGIGLQGLGVVSTIVIAHFFAPSELGKVAFGLTLTTFLIFVGGSQGLAGALIRQQETPEAADLETAVGLQLVVGVVIALATTAIGSQFGEVGQLTALMVWALPVAAFRVPALAMLERRLAYRQIVGAEVAEVLVYQVWQIGTVLAGWGVWGLASAVICRSFAGTAVLVAVSSVRYLRPRLDRSRARRILGIGLRIQATELVETFRDQGVNLAAGAVGGLSVLGLWSMAYRALQFPLTVFTSLWRVSFPAATRMLALGKDPRPLIQDTLRLAAPGCGVILVPLAACSPALFPALLGHRWSGAALAVPPACLGLMVGIPIYLAGVGYLWAIGDGNTPLRASVCNAAAWFAVSLPLMPVLGVSAIGIGMFAAYVMQAVVIARGVRKHIDVVFVRPVLVPAAVAVASTALPLLGALEHRSWAVMLASAAVGECSYVGGLLLFYRPTARQLAALALRPVLARAGTRVTALAPGR